MSDHSEHAHGSENIVPAHSKIVSMRALLVVWAALCGMTVLTTFLAGINLHGFNTAASLIIAGIMAIIAALYFMHLRYDHPFYIFMLLLVIVFITIFISFSATDTLAYKAQFIQGEAPLMVQAAHERQEAAKAPATTSPDK